jgi:predicted PurR-regulated permease PerM
MGDGVFPKRPEADLRKRIGNAALLLATGVAFYLCWLLARPFLAAITWALALAVIGYPLYRRLEGRLRPNLAALISVLTIAVILLAPGFLAAAGNLQRSGRQPDRALREPELGATSSGSKAVLACSTGS